LSLEHSGARLVGANRGSAGKSKRNPWAGTSPPDLADRFLSRREAAAYLNLTVSQLAHDVVHQRLKIPYYKFGLRAKYKRSELDAWAERNRRQAGPAA
jgi:excisionase family DNA binding protein